jgi:hypothetical protein
LGDSEAAEARSTGIGPSSGRGRRETRNRWFCAEIKLQESQEKKEQKQEGGKTKDGKNTYRGQGMLGVGVISGQFRNFMILGKSSKSSDPSVKIFLLHKIF